MFSFLHAMYDFFKCIPQNLDKFNLNIIIFYLNSWVSFFPLSLIIPHITSANLTQLLAPFCCCMLIPLPAFVRRYVLAGVGIFVLGILIGWFTHAPMKRPAVSSPESSDLLEELLRGIKADKINALQK